jgi:predicted DNA-binding protein YlxM (UPF0122 family)
MSTPVQEKCLDQSLQNVNLFGTPCRSLLKSAGPARRVENSAIKEPIFNFFRAVDHFSMFERVKALEAERDALKTEVDKLQEQLTEYQENMKMPQYNVRDELQAEIGPLSKDTSGEEVLLSKVQLLQLELSREQHERRKAHNQLMEIRGNVRPM